MFSIKKGEMHFTISNIFVLVSEIVSQDHIIESHQMNK